MRPPAMVFGRHSRSRERRVLLGRRAAGVLAAWSAVRGRHAGKLFLHLDRWGNPTGKPMSALGVHWVLKSRSKKASTRPSPRPTSGTLHQGPHARGRRGPDHPVDKVRRSTSRPTKIGPKAPRARNTRSK
jgi:hypothetical protein